MINVKIDKGVSTMTFAGSGLEVAVEIGVMVHGLYTQLYHRAGPAIAKGCKKVLRDMLAREDSPVWDVNLDKNAGILSSWKAMRRQLRLLRGGAS